MNKIEASIGLDGPCTDTIKVQNKFITLACAETKSISFMDRVKFVPI